MDDISRMCGNIKDFLGPRPNLAILRVNQGKVEICLRVALIVLAFLTFLPGAVLNTHLKDEGYPADEIGDPIKVTRTGAQWIMVVCWMAIFYQLLGISLRFINLVVLENYVGFFLIAAIVVRILFIISWFAGAINFAVRSSTWLELKKQYSTEDRYQNVSFSTIMSSSAAASSFCFFTLPVDIGLVVWLILWLVLRWQQLIIQQLRYQAGPTERDTEDLTPEEYD